MTTDEKIEKHETSFHTLVFEEEGNKELKKNDGKGIKNVGFVTIFCREIKHLCPYNLYDFCHLKQDVPSLLRGVFIP